MRTAIVGGGAAGFFLAVNLKEMMPEMDVTIFERSSRVLAKVEVSGGGRCNCTNSFAQVSDLSQVYPRGHRLMKRLFNVFDYEDAYQWFERHGVPLVTQDDECVFPQAQDSHAVINCFLSLARHHHINICTGRKIQSLDELAGYDYVAVTTGGSPKGEGLRWLAALGHEIEAPVPSLFTFSVADDKLHALQGLVVEEAAALIPGTKYRAEGPLLITHWGLSGPAILKLSSYAARHLADNQYRAPLSINWLKQHEEEVQAAIRDMSHRQPQKLLTTCNPFRLQQRLWSYLQVVPPSRMSSSPVAACRSKRSVPRRLRAVMCPVSFLPVKCLTLTALLAALTSKQRGRRPIPLHVALRCIKNDEHTMNSLHKNLAIRIFMHTFAPQIV